MHEPHAATIAMPAAARASPSSQIRRCRRGDPTSTLLAIVMIMTVEPGWGGQGSWPTARRIGGARDSLMHRGTARVHVDGGINHETAEFVGSHGVDVRMVGSALFSGGATGPEGGLRPGGADARGFGATPDAAG